MSRTNDGTMGHDDEGRDLGRALHDRVDSMTEAPLTLGDVQGRARRLRRNRRIVAGVGVAAAAAILVPTAILAGDGLQRSSEPGFATGTPSPSVSASATTSPTPAATQPFDVSDLPTGSAPGIAWADGRTIHRADGSTVEVTGVDRIGELAPMGAGWVVATDDSQGNLEAVLVDASGAAGDRYPLDGSLATSPEGDVVAWVAPDGTVRAVDDGGSRVVEHSTVQVPGPYDAVAVVGEACIRGASGGCTVFVRTLGEKVASYTMYQDGTSNEVVGGLLSVTAVRAPWLAGITELHEDLTTCSRVGDEATTVWDTCDFRVLGFSPDGRHAVAVGTIGDGFSDRELAILATADGTPLVHLQSTGQSFASNLDQVWEDDSHVLTVTWQDGEWAVVRVGLDGSMEYAVAPVSGSDMERPFFLQTR